MKHQAYILISLISLSFLASCAKEPVPSVRQQGSRDVSYAISMADIQEYLSGYKNIPPTKSADVRVEPILSKGDTVSYLINYDEGWELLSADRRAPRVFAQCNKGNTTIEQLIGDNPVLGAIYKNYVGNMRLLKANPQLEIENEYQDSWNDVLIPDRALGWELFDTMVFFRDSIQNHLTQTRWGQTNSLWRCRMPYMDSTLTTHCYPGCSPVAIAQMLYYLHQTIGKPENAYGESYTTAYIHPGADHLSLSFNDVVLDESTYSTTTWGNMALTSSDTGSFAAVSTLMLLLGIQFGASYQHDKTSASTGMCYNVFRERYYIDMDTSSTIDYDTISHQIRRELQPIILVVSFDEGSGRVRHTVIADACKERYQVTREVYRRLKPIPEFSPLEHPYEYMYVESTEFVSRYLGINWGWEDLGMTNNGGTIWFSTDVINWHVGYTYTAVEDMYYNFRELTN